jgi:lipopolysaccharide transport system ATP-binding protein
MSDIVIKAENLGKKYMIGHQAERGRYVALRDVLMHGARTLWNKTKDLAKGKSIIQGDTLEEVWALKDVSFEIKRGEAVGIIGRNGAGKSTLLKVLSRITEPSAGRVTIKGRVASLLEIGTGFHPELTGRENIYLNGTILGMARKEVKGKFDEIVAFSEIEKYLDTPVKRYSSGMYMRLAFAVAAHLDPEIVLVDEVLAVGDAAFQKKCLGKMGEVTHEGRTVLFVSHNMTAVRSLCPKGILLENGKIICDSAINNVLSKYIQKSSDKINWTGIDGSREISIYKTYIKSLSHTIHLENTFYTDQNLEIGIELSINDEIKEVGIGCIILTSESIPLIRLFYNDFNEISKLSKGRYLVKFMIPSYHLAKGNYQISFDISLPNIQRVNSENINLSFELLSNDVLGNRYNSEPNPTFTSLIRPNWFKEILRIEDA